MGIIVYNVQDEYEGLRIDRFLSEQSEDLSRSYIQKLIRENRLEVNGMPVKSSYQVRSDDAIRFEVPANQEPEILPENIPLDILYEDSCLIVINKPKGMVVHPAAGHYSGALVNALMYHCKDLSGINGILRPGIVHRKDKDTSGILVCAKNEQANRNLAEQLKEHSITRRYEAICVGTFQDPEGTVTGSIGRNPNNRKLMAINEKNGKPAVTHYEVLKQYAKYAHIRCRLETGRTHQIRVHMTSIHHPLVGDILYGGHLSEFRLGFVHPLTEQYMEFDTQLPDYFQLLLRKLDSTIR